MAIDTSGIENLAELDFLDSLARVTGNTQSGDSVQNISVTDIICEGPVKGLVGKTSGVYFNDVSADYAEYAEFIPSQNDAYGKITFQSGSTTGTFANGITIPEDIDLAVGSIRSLVLIDYAIAEVTISKDSGDEADYIYTATYQNGISFSDSKWTADDPTSLDLYSIGPDGESLELYTVRFVSHASNQIKFYKQTNFASELDTSKTYSLRRRKYLLITAFNQNRDGLTVAEAPNTSGSPWEFSFRITQPQVINPIGVWSRNNSTLASRGKIDQLQIQSRNGEREQDPIVPVEGVGGGQTSVGNPSSINLPTLKMLSPQVASNLGVALIDPNGMPDGSTDYNEAATILTSSDFGIQPTQAPEVDQLRWSIRYPSLQTINLNSGAKETAHAYYIMQVQFIRPGATQFEATWNTCFPNESTNEEDYIVHTGNTNAPTSFDHVLNLAPFGPFIDFRIRIIRVNRHLGLPITPDGTAGGRTDKNKWQVAATGAISSLTATINDIFNYPYTAVVSSTFSSRQFGNIPKRSYLMEGLIVKVPSNYTPREYTTEGVAKYDGLWDGSFKPLYTDNPAWVFYDIVTNNRYGAGKWISKEDIDEYALYRIAKYCDELVPSGKKDDQGNDILEPRFRANIFLAKAADVYKVLKDMATVFLGILYWQDGKLTAVQDAPQDPIYNFSKSNVIDGKFSYESTGTRTRINQVVVTWNDPEVNYEPVPVIVEDREAIAKAGRIISQNSVAFGATSEGQAIRYGRWKLWTAQNQTEVVSFKTSLAAHYVKAGDVITVQDADRYGLQYSGRINSATLNSVTLDREIEFLSGADYTLNTVVSAAGAFWTGVSDLIIGAGDPIKSGELVKEAYVPGYGTTPTAIDTEDKASNAFQDSSYSTPLPLVWRPYTYVQQTPIQNPEALASTITTNNTFDIEPSAGTVWSITEANVPGSAEIDYRDSDLKRLGSTKEYRVLSITEDSKNEFSISAVEHFNSKYKVIEEGYEVAIITNPQTTQETGGEIIPRPRNLRVVVDTDIANPNKALSLEWDAPKSDTPNAGLVTKYELYHNVPNTPSPIITSETRYSFDFVPAGILSAEVRSVTKKNNRSRTISLRYEVPYFDTNIDRWQEGIPKGITASSTLVIESSGNKTYFEADPTVAVSFGSHLDDPLQLTQADEVNLEYLLPPAESFVWGANNVDHYIALRGGSLYLMYYDTETFPDFPMWKEMQSFGGNYYGPGIWDTVVSNISIPNDSNTITVPNHGLQIRDKIVFFNGPEGSLGQNSAESLQTFRIFRDWPGYVLEAFHPLSAPNPIAPGSKIRLSNIGQSIVLEGGGYLQDGEYYVSRTTELQQSSSVGIKNLYTTYEDAMIDATQGGTWDTNRVPIASVVDKSDGVDGTEPILRVVGYPANVISIIDQNTFVIDRIIDAVEIQAQNASIYKRQYLPDYSTDSIFAKVRHNGAEYELTKYINLDIDIRVGKYVAVNVSDPLIQYNFASEEQITDPGAISVTATAIGFRNPRFKVFEVSDGIPVEALDTEFLEANDGPFNYTKVIVPAGTDIPYNGGASETILIQVVEFSNIDSPYDGEGLISKTTAGADGVSGKTVYLDAEDLTIIYNQAGENPQFNDTSGDSTTITFVAEALNFENPVYKFDIDTSALAVPGDFTLFYPAGTTIDGLGFVDSNIAYVTVPSSFESWKAKQPLLESQDGENGKYKMEVQVAETNNTTTPEAFDNVLIQGIHATRSGYWTSLSNPSHTVATTSEGIPIGEDTGTDSIVAINSGTSIEVGKGGTVLTYVPAATFNGLNSSDKIGKYTITSITESPSSAIVFTDGPLSAINASNPKLISLPDYTFSTVASAWTGDTTSLTFNIDAEGAVDLVRTQVFTKSKQGFGGVTIIQKNPFESIPADKNGQIVEGAYELTKNSINVILFGIDVPFYSGTATAGDAEFWWEYASSTPTNIDWIEPTFPAGPVSGFVEVGEAEAMIAATAEIEHTIRIHIGEAFEDYTVTQVVTKNTNASNVSAYVNKPHYSYDGDGGAPNPSTGYSLNWIITVPEGLIPVVEIDGSGVAIPATTTTETFPVPGFDAVTAPGGSYEDGAPIVHTVKLYNETIAEENLLDIDTVVVSRSKNAPDGIILDIDNDAATVGGIEGEDVTGFAELITATVFKAGVDDTANWTFFWNVSVDATDTSITGAVSGTNDRSYLVTGLNNGPAPDNNEFTFANIIVRAEHIAGEYDDHEKTFTITKILNGKNGVVYKIIPNTNVVTYDPDSGIFEGGTGTDNNEVSFSFVQIEDGLQTPFSGQYSFDGGSTLQGPATSSTSLALVPGTLENLTCSLFSADGNQLYDRSSVPLVKSGAGSRTIQISASAQNFIKLKNGQYTPSAINLIAKKLGGVTGTANWSGTTFYAADLVTPVTSGDSVYILPDSLTNGGVTVTLTVEDSYGTIYTDSEEIGELKDGTDAISISLDNDNVTVSADPDNKVTGTLSTSGTTITVYQGATLLDYDGVGNSPGKWTVTSTPSQGLVPGTITEAGEQAQAGAVGAGTGNFSTGVVSDATITFNVSGQTFDGTPFTETKVQTFSKAKAGVIGVNGDSVNIAFTRVPEGVTPTATGTGALPDDFSTYEWSNNPPAGTDLLWAVKGTFNVETELWTWGTPYQLQGVLAVELYVYQKKTNGGAATSNPPDDTSYNFKTGEWDAPTGWSKSKPGLTADGDIIYESYAVASGGPETTNANLNWSSAFVAAQRQDGEDGTSVTGPTGPRSSSGFVYYQTSSTSNPGKPSGSSFDFTSNTFGTLTAGWDEAAPTFSAGNTNKYWYSRYAVLESSFGGSQTIAFSDAVQGIGFTGLVTFTSNTADKVEVSDGTNTLSFGSQGTTTIDGGQITTGQIDAQRLNVGQINVTQTLNYEAPPTDTGQLTNGAGYQTQAFTQPAQINVAQTTNYVAPPTDTGQLTNGAGYQTQAFTQPGQINVTQTTNYVAPPTVISQLTNDSNYQSGLTSLAQFSNSTTQFQTGLTNLNQFTNGPGYQTAAFTQPGQINVTQTTNYVAPPTQTSQLTNNSGYQTNAVEFSATAISGGKIGLSTVGLVIADNNISVTANNSIILDTTSGNNRIVIYDGTTPRVILGKL